MGISRLGSEIPTHVPGKVVTQGFQEHGLESALDFRLDICLELGIQALGSNRLGTPWVRRSPRSGLQSARELRLAPA